VKAITTAQPLVDRSVVAKLEEILAEAKKGEITGFAMVTQDQVRAASYITQGLNDRYTITGYLFHLLWKLQRDGE
jgi:hypothetical protein